MLRIRGANANGREHDRDKGNAQRSKRGDPHRAILLRKDSSKGSLTPVTMLPLVFENKEVVKNIPRAANEIIIT